MSQSYKTIHEFSAIASGQTLTSINNAGTAITLTAAQSGEIIVLNSTSGSAVTLSAPEPGLSYRFIVGVTGGHTITAPSATILGSVTSAITSTAATSLLTTGAAKTSIATTAGSVRGDTISLVSNGGAYYVSGAVSTFNALVFGA
jgi:hypothetical protein